MVEKKTQSHLPSELVTNEDFIVNHYHLKNRVVFAYFLNFRYVAFSLIVKNMILLNVTMHRYLIKNQLIYKYMQILIIYVTIVVVANILDKKNDIDILRILSYH